MIKRIAALNMTLDGIFGHTAGIANENYINIIQIF